MTSSNVVKMMMMMMADGWGNGASAEAGESSLMNDGTAESSLMGDGAASVAGQAPIHSWWRLKPLNHFHGVLCVWRCIVLWCASWRHSGVLHSTNVSQLL